jgi:hypothetical protein
LTKYFGDGQTLGNSTKPGYSDAYPWIVSPKRLATVYSRNYCNYHYYHRLLKLEAISAFFFYSSSGRECYRQKRLQQETILSRRMVCCLHSQGIIRYLSLRIRDCMLTCEFAVAWTGIHVTMSRAKESREQCLHPPCKPIYISRYPAHTT